MNSIPENCERELINRYVRWWAEWDHNKSTQHIQFNKFLYVAWW